MNKTSHLTTVGIVMWWPALLHHSKDLDLNPFGAVCIKIACCPSACMGYPGIPWGIKNKPLSRESDRMSRCVPVWVVHKEPLCFNLHQTTCSVCLESSGTSFSWVIPDESLRLTAVVPSDHGPFHSLSRAVWVLPVTEWLAPSTLEEILLCLLCSAHLSDNSWKLWKPWLGGIRRISRLSDAIDCFKLL